MSFNTQMWVPALQYVEVDAQQLAIKQRHEPRLVQEALEADYVSQVCTTGFQLSSSAVVQIGAEFVPEPRRSAQALQPQLRHPR